MPSWPSSPTSSTTIQQTVANAFCNHVLHETIARGRQAALEEVA